MRTPKYLVAKYIPDLERMEPRNIGVVVWSPEGIEARFAAEKPDNPGEIDGRSIPSFVTSSNAYRQWIQFWRAELEKAEIEAADGTTVPHGSPDFLSGLQSWNRGSFVLAEGGMLLDPVHADDLTGLALHLYDWLVEASGTDEPRDPTLDELCDKVLEETRLADDPHFVSRYEITCQVAADTTERFEFSHAYHNGTLWRVYQRVPLSKRKTLLRKTVHDSAWMLEKVAEANIISREHSAALVYVTDEQRSESAISEALQVLASVSRVLNLDDYGAVRNEFASLPTSS